MLSKDTATKMALELDIKDIAKLCQTSKIFNNYICDNDIFWLNKIRKDYPEFNIKEKKNFKELYMEISKDVEIIISIVIQRSEYEENEFGEESEIEKEINIDERIRFKGYEDIEDIRMKIKDIISDFFQTISLFGMYYDIKIDDVDVCQDVKYISSCFNTVTKNTEYIVVYFTSQDEIDEDDTSHYQEILTNIVNEK